MYLLASFSFEKIKLSGLGFHNFYDLAECIGILSSPLQTDGYLIRTYRTVNHQMNISQTFLRVPAPNQVFSGIYFKRIRTLPPSGQFDTDIIYFRTPFQFICNPGGVQPALHREVADHEETIEALQDRIQTMQADHSRQMAEVERKHRREIADKETKHKEEISFLKTVIAKAAAWFPYFREMLRIENLCRLVGFDERQTATLVKGKPLEYAGELYSEEHGRKFTTEKAGFQVLKDPTDGTRLVLAIDRKPIAEWFKEQFDKLRQSIRRPIQPQRKSRGI